MKTNVKIALYIAAFVMFCSTATSAFAFESGILSGIFPQKATPVYEDDSFFGGEALTFGNLELSAYESSSLDGFYAECASCAGNAQPAAVAYEYPVVSYGYSYSYSYEPTYVVSRPYRAVRNFRPVRKVLRGVRNVLFNRFNYCKPAYVCDPCWNVCDACNVCAESYVDWAPCAVDPCVPVCSPCGAVYAPATCCGNGEYPGEIKELNPETGVARTGIDSTVKSAPQPKSAPISTDEVEAPAQPAIPNVPAQPAQPAGTELPSYDSNSIETIQPSEPVGAGVIRMLVPEDSVVYVNGYRTKQTGATRTFAAKSLKYGETYEFEIRVVAVRNGKTYEDVQTTTLTAGNSSALAFNLKLRDDEVYAYSK